MTEVDWFKYDVGSHVPFSGSLAPSILYGIEMGMYSIQVFLGNPKRYERTEITERDIIRSNEVLDRYPMYVYTHFPYTSNMAGSIKDGLAWEGNSKIDWSMRQKIAGIEHELKVLSKLSAKRTGVVIHPGAYPDRKKGHIKVSESINKINFVDGSFLLLEVCAGEGNKLCKSLHEIHTVIQGVDEDKKKYIGVCIDTAHIWGSGEYRLDTLKGVDKLFEDFENILGMDSFHLLHLNDSKVEFGSKQDRHELIGKGKIWGDDMIPLVYLLDKCKKNEIPIILETEPGDVSTILEIQKMALPDCC